ncbi:MAG: CoA pyrophosphatase [Candidatus Dormibacteria bacterium]
MRQPLDAVPDDAELVARLRRAIAGHPGGPEPPANRPNAAVLFLADPAGPGVPALFMLRSDRVRFHRGQIALPGGGQEPHDLDATATALREAHEELGVPPDAVEVLGSLPPMETATSDRWLTPVVGLQRRPFDVVADLFEVAEWFRLPLAELWAAPHEVRRFGQGTAGRDVHFYTAGDRVVWGVTGAIVHELLARLRRLG